MDELLGVGCEAARRAGALLLQGRGKAQRIETKSTPTDMVSDLDRASETVIRAVIGERRPGDAFLGEEGDRTTGTTGVRWIVDPLDGTTNFLYGFPVWSVSVAAERDGAVVAGVVFDPVHDELWTAVRGEGAACNEVPLETLADDVELATALVATGFAYAAETRAGQGRVAAYLLPRVRDVRRAGSAAIDLCWVAAGRVDAYFESGTHVWDRAAGSLIAAEAGAWVGGFTGGRASDEGVLAAPPSLATALQALIAEAPA